MQINRLTQFILVGMVLGVIAGYVSYRFFPDSSASVAGITGFLPAIFLRLIKMIIAPLVFATLVSGIARMGDGKAVGRVGAKTMLWFISASMLSLSLGLVLVNWFAPGTHLDLALPANDAKSGISTSGFTAANFIEHLIPTSIVEAMAHNEILQIVIFSVFFGGAMATMPERSKALLDVIDNVAHIMLKVTAYVMLFAPLAVFGALVSTVAKNGVGIIVTYGIFMGEFYFSLLMLWLLLLLACSIFVGSRVLILLRRIREPLLLAFSTASSEAAYPKTLEELERFGCNNKIASFVLPLGYSFNLDGSMMYCTFAVMFIAQAYGIELSLSQQIVMLGILMVTSKGIAGVPRASLVVIAATLSQFNIPEAGLLLLLGIDHFLDMGRSATNVVGNSVATVVVSKWEKALNH